ncbi:hypothetical protein IKP13_01570 [bacterium]|nr:hypothetical protein [bacterium]
MNKKEKNVRKSKKAVGKLIGLGVVAFIAICAYNSLTALSKALKEKEERENQS